MRAPRRIIFATWLMATTALYPTQADAMPIIAGFIGGIVTALGAGAVGGTIAGIGGGFAAGAFAAGYGLVGTIFGGGFIANLALSIGFSLLAAALRPKPQTPDPGQKVVNLRQPISFFEFVYGRVRKGGPVNFWQAKDGRRYIDVIIAARQIESFVSRFLDEREATIDYGDDNLALPEDWFERKIAIEEFNGAPGQAAPAFLLDNFTEWTAAHDMKGLAHATLICANAKPDDFASIYPSGREPVYTALVDGFLIYDPRDLAQDPDDSTTWAYSNNGALVIADWIVSADGLGRSVNWAKVAIEADKADLDVTDRDGNIRKKWQLAGSYSSADERETVRANMGVACDAMFYEDDDGTVGFYVGGYEEPDITISDDDILRVQYSEGQPGTDIKNAQVVSYTEPEQGYREAASAPYVIVDPSEAYSEDALNVFWIPNHNQAVRVAKRLLTVSRAKYRLSATLKYQAIRLKGKRYIRWQHSEFGGLDMVFEVDKLVRNDDGITFTLDAHSVTEADFEFDAITEEPEKPKRNGIEEVTDVPDPTGVTATVEIFAGAPTVLVEWDDPPRASLLNRVRYRNQSGPGEWFEISVPIGQYYQRIFGLEDNATYDIQVGALTPTGTRSKWAPYGTDEDDPTLAVTILIDSTAPLALASFSAVGGMGNAAVPFATASGDAHIRTVGIYRVAAGGAAPTAASTPLAQVLVSAGSTFTYTDGDGTRTNMLENPGFDSDTLWTKGANWTIAAGVASKSAGGGNSLSQADTYVAGSVYRYRIEIPTLSGGSFTPRLSGGTTVTGTAYTTTGMKYGSLTAAAGGNTLWGILGATAAVGTVDNVVSFLQTAACVAQGDYDYYAIPFNQSGIDGPVSGPVTVTII